MTSGVVLIELRRFSSSVLLLGVGGRVKAIEKTRDALPRKLNLDCPVTDNAVSGDLPHTYSHVHSLYARRLYVKRQFTLDKS